MNKAFKDLASSGGFGGGIYIQTANVSSNIPAFNFDRCIFDQNFAELAGGGYFVFGVPP